MISRVSQLDVHLGPDDVIGAALLSPGFCEDLTTWRLTIDESGLLVQEIFLYCDPLYLSEKLIRTSQLSNEELEKLRRLAEEIDFVGLNEEYDPQADDAEATTIVVKTSSGSKRAYASDAFHAAAHEGEPDIQRYVRLWNAILEHAPTSSAAWRQDKEQAELRMNIARLRLRVNEKDFVLPTVDNLVGAILCPPAIGLLLQLFSWNQSGGMRDFPDMPQLILWSCIMYAVLILVFVYQVYARRRQRLAAERQLAQLQSEYSAFIDQEPETEH